MLVRKTFWGLLAILILGVVGRILIPDEFYIRLVYLISLLISLSWIWAFFSVKGIDVSRFSRVSRLQVGQIFDETIEVTNHFPLFRLWLEVRDKAPLPGSSGSRILSWIQGRATRSYSVYTLLIQRGEFSLGPTILISGDPFGLFTENRVIPGGRSLLVLPYSVDLESFASPPGLLPGGRALRRRSLDITPHAASIREYVHGDSLNRIHWATSAKRDRLMVKEFDQDPQADIWLFLDSCQNGLIVSKDPADSTKKGRSWIWWNQREEFRLYPSTYEYAVSSSASIAKYFIRLGLSVGFVSVGQIYTNLNAEKGERQLGKILETLSFLRCEGELPLHGLVETHVSYLPRGSTVVLVTSSVSDDVILAVDELQLRQMRPIVVIIDPQSFGSLSKAEPVLLTLFSHGVPVTIISKDKNLKQALEKIYIPGNLSQN
jgi:uncharacterized protein (DUF58 family)